MLPKLKNLAKCCLNLIKLRQMLPKSYKKISPNVAKCRLNPLKKFRQMLPKYYKKKFRQMLPKSYKKNFAKFRQMLPK